MRFWTKAASISVLALLVMGAKGCEPEKMTTSGICAWVNENIVQAKKTDHFDTKKASAAQIRWYNDNC
jgi:hypothetical protein